MNITFQIHPKIYHLRNTHVQVIGWGKGNNFRIFQIISFQIDVIIR